MSEPTRARSRVDLDLSLLGSFEAPGVFTRIDPVVDAALEALPEVHERVEGVVHFCHWLGMSGSSTESKARVSQEDLRAKRKYLRAALTEFASMEDAARIDLGGTARALVRDLPDPRLHVVRLLRHANVHLGLRQLEHAEREAVWPGPQGDQQFMYQLIGVSDVDSSIRETRNSEHYTPESLDLMISWLETEQWMWGINHLVLRTAEAYARALLLLRAA